MQSTARLSGAWSGVVSDPVLVVRAGALLAIAVLYIGRIASGVAPEVRFFDDFFYYVIAAENWVDGKGSTYFPGELTNGYHPLWFVWIASLYRLTGEANGVFFALVDLSVLALLAGFFLLFERFLFRLTQDRLAAAVGAGLAAVRIGLVASTGVEMALTVFAAALLLERVSAKPMREQSVRDAAVIGLCGAFLALSRLDALMIAPAMALIALLRWDWKRLAAAAIAGAVPLAIYFAINLTVFGSISTASMAAKSLATYFPPNWFVLAGPLVRTVGLFAGCVVAALLLRRVKDVDLRRIGWALITVPAVQIAVMAVMSGWQIFPWYHYYAMMALGLAAALMVVVVREMKLPLLATGAAFAALAYITAAWTTDALRPQSPQKEIAGLAHQLKAFAKDHPGVYAMGDAAGVPGWMIGQPIVHLEGLMMSHDFLDRIRTQQPLEETFRDYRVNYYVAVWLEDEKDGCLSFAEPSRVQASDRAPKMHATICEPPVAHLKSGEIYDVRIYRIDPATGQPVAPNAQGG